MKTFPAEKLKNENAGAWSTRALIFSHLFCKKHLFKCGEFSRQKTKKNTAIKIRMRHFV